MCRKGVYVWKREFYNVYIKEGDICKKGIYV